MMQSEFEQLTTKKISSEDYLTLEAVYTFHPCFNINKPKEAAAKMFTLFGIAPFKAMLESAQTIASMEARVQAMRIALEKEIEAMNDYKKIIS